MPSDDLAQRQQAALTGFVGKPHPQVPQPDSLLRQKGGASDSFRMLDLRVACDVAATNQRVAAGRSPILPDALEPVDTFRHDGSCVCFVCADSYEIEPDGFGDGCMKYYFPMMIERLEEEDE